MQTPNRKTMIAQRVKEARLAKGYTQQEVADHTNISLRSIQRIEGGEVAPRTHTLKMLAAFLDIPLQDLLSAGASAGEPTENSIPRKIVLSIGLSLLIVLLYLAFAAQSTFPETGFEALNGLAALVGMISLLLVWIWKRGIKPIFTIAFMVVTLLLALAFVAQAPAFPETGFEALLYGAGVVAFIMVVLLRMWRKTYKEEHP